MSTAIPSHELTSAPNVEQDADDQPVVAVHSCSRLGRTASPPPRSSLFGWLRFRRRR